MSGQSQFAVGVLIKSAEETPEGDWIVSGPLHDLDIPDYEGETIEKAGLLEGLKTFFKLGRHVDWEHMYRKTHDPEVLIGKAMEVREVNGKPWLVTRLYKGKSLAQKAWQHLREGGELGYSVEGTATRDPKKRTHLLKTVITRVTISPSPMSFGSRLQEGTPGGSAIMVAKALCQMFDLQPVGSPVAKALTTGGGIVPEGATGGMALRAQSMGAGSQRRCSSCRTKNHNLRKACRKCGANLSGNVSKSVTLQARLDESIRPTCAFDRTAEKLVNAGMSVRQARELAGRIHRRLGSALAPTTK